MGESFVIKADEAQEMSKSYIGLRQYVYSKIRIAAEYGLTHIEAVWENFPCLDDFIEELKLNGYTVINDKIKTDHYMITW